MCPLLCRETKHKNVHEIGVIQDLGVNWPIWRVMLLRYDFISLFARWNIKKLKGLSLNIGDVAYLTHQLSEYLSNNY